MQRLYLYLASRSKKGIKLITILQGESQVTSKVTDLKTLNLPQVWQNQIQKIIYDHRMLYEPWIESAKNYEELKTRLKERSFTDIPLGPLPLLNMGDFYEFPKADTSSCKIKTTMVRRKQD